MLIKWLKTMFEMSNLSKCIILTHYRIHTKALNPRLSYLSHVSHSRPNILSVVNYDLDFLKNDFVCIRHLSLGLNQWIYNIQLLCKYQKIYFFIFYYADWICTSVQVPIESKSSILQVSLIKNSFVVYIIQ